MEVLHLHMRPWKCYIYISNAGMLQASVRFVYMTKHEKLGLCSYTKYTTIHIIVCVSFTMYPLLHEIPY